MKKKIFALLLIIIFMISANGCTLGYSTPFHGEPDGIMVCLMDSNHKYLYEYGGPYAHYRDESKIPLLSIEEDYILEVDLTGGPFLVASSGINFTYEEEKLEIIELNDYGEFILRILECFEETTIVVSHDAFSCDVLIKMQPSEIVE